MINKLCTSSFTLGVGRKWYALLGSHIELEKLSKVPLIVDISYSDNIGEHHETTKIELDQYLWSIIYNSATDDSAQELKKITKSLQAIEKKLPKA